ncbi:MAG: murein L,D-transpeptidase catalytic domain family protein [Chlorobi bacterium]|nr:murein L,D-transpeptidase catalytic domain family protein [Chlorobiota bacterium]
MSLRLKKTIYILFLFIVAFFSKAAGYFHDYPENAQENMIKKEYKELNCHSLRFEAFRNAVKGYYILKNKGILNNDSVITIIDFSKSSKKERMYVINIKQNKLILKTLVAHGKNTGLEYAQRFSNKNKSYQSSTGFYLTGESYQGKHGYSLRLKGLEKGINDNAEERAIVIHPAKYATYDFIKKYGRLGRSFGCPAIPPGISEQTINTIKNGSLLYIYHPDYTGSTILHHSINKK